MYRVSTTGGLGAPALPPPDPSGAAGVSTAGFDVHPVHTAVTTDRGRYWTADGRDPIATHFRPIQPRTDLDVTPTDGAVVHGALITALASTDVTDVNPVLSRPTIDLAEHEPETGPDDVAFPATLQRVQDYAAPDGRHVRLNLAAGQFLSNPSDPEGRGVQRLFTRIAGNVLRSRSTDFAPPRIDHVETVKSGGNVTFDVTTPDTDVTSGLALYQDAAGVWRSAALTVTGGHARGSGPLPGDTQNAGVAFVQLVDAAGNVGLATDKGEGFALSPASDPGANAPPLVPDPLPGPNGTTPGPVTVRITGAARATARVSVDGAAFAAYEAPIVLTTSGVHVIAARAPDGSTSRLTIIIPTANTPPVASDDAYAVIGGATLTVPAPGVLGNDTDADNDALTAQLVNPTTKGTLTLNPNGSLTYTPGEDTTGTDTFTYRAFDGLATSNLATVTITITAGCDGVRATRVGTTGSDTLTGTGGNDVIVALGGNDTIDAGSGNDRVCGGSGNDTIELGSGDDRGFGGTGTDSLRGGSGDDILRGGEGNDLLDGGGERDQLFGDGGADRLFGGGDPDTLDGGDGSPDLCDGEGGSDTATAACEQRNNI
jgi:VCBS repeat-containing protein